MLMLGTSADWLRTEISYGPPGRSRVARNRPLASVVSVRVTPLRKSSTTTVSPAMGAPPSSRTLPRMLDVVSCANPATGTMTMRRAATQARTMLRHSHGALLGESIFGITIVSDLGVLAPLLG